MASRTVHIVAPSVLLHIPSTTLARAFLRLLLDPLLVIPQHKCLRMTVVILITAVPIMPGDAMLVTIPKTASMACNERMVRIYMDLAPRTVWRDAPVEVRICLGGSELCCVCKSVDRSKHWNLSLPWKWETHFATSCGDKSIAILSFESAQPHSRHLI